MGPSTTWLRIYGARFAAAPPASASGLQLRRRRIVAGGGDALTGASTEACHISVLLRRNTHTHWSLHGRTSSTSTNGNSSTRLGSTLQATRSCTHRPSCADDYYAPVQSAGRHATTMANDLDKKQTIVHINASITHDSVTARVATAVIDHLTHHYHRHVQNGVSKPQSPEDVLNIEELDVWSDQLPKFDRETMQKVWRARNNSQDEADIAAFRPIQAMAEQILRADFLMVTVPVWNFSVPYVLKQYIDCIVQPGLTFKNADASGPSGPFFKGRPVIIISSSGGKAPPPNEDFVVPFLTKIFAMCGFDEAHHVAIQGLANHDKQTCFENAVKEANAIADLVVTNHKLRLDVNEDEA